MNSMILKTGEKKYDYNQFPRKETIWAFSNILTNTPERVPFMKFYPILLAKFSDLAFVEREL